jgi:hypothetical protein
MTRSHEREPDRPLDLSVLSASADPTALEELVARVMEAAEPELSRRAASRRRSAAGGALIALAGWTRPILAAAAVVGVISTGVLRWAPTPGMSGGQEEEMALLPEVLGLPTTVATWLDEDRAPTTRDLVLAMEDGEGWR